MNDNQALTKANGGALAPFGSRDEVREMTERLRLMLPGVGQSLSKGQILALAQGAVAHGLNPLNGEIWIIVDRDGNSRGLQIGIKGLRKKAHEQVKGNFWCEFIEITDPDTRARWQIAASDLAFECRLFDSETIRLYVEAIERLQTAKLPWEVIERMVGARPYTTGIGILKANEKTKMAAVQCARKRAEADAIKQRFDVPFGVAVAEDDEPPAFAGEWIEGKATEAAQTTDGRGESNLPAADAQHEPDPAEAARIQAEWEAEQKRIQKAGQYALWPPA